MRTGSVFTSQCGWGQLINNSARQRRAERPTQACFACVGTRLIARFSRLAGKVKASPDLLLQRIGRAGWSFAAPLQPRWARRLRGCFDQGVVFALSRMSLVARDQQDGTLLTSGVRSKPRDLSSVVDVVRFRYCHIRAWKNEGLQVDDGTSVLP